MGFGQEFGKAPPRHSQRLAVLMAQSAVPVNPTITLDYDSLVVLGWKVLQGDMHLPDPGIHNGHVMEGAESVSWLINPFGHPAVDLINRL